MKMYIAVLDEAPDSLVPGLVAHAVLSYNHMIGYGNSSNQSDYERLYDRWYYQSFEKCVIRVSREEFETIYQLDNVGLFRQDTVLSGEYSCAVIVVDKNVPDILKSAELWKPNYQSRK